MMSSIPHFHDLGYNKLLELFSHFSESLLPWPQRQKIGKINEAADQLTLASKRVSQGKNIVRGIQVGLD